MTNSPPTTTYQLQPTNYKLLVIVGPTSSGKSELAVKLAKRFNGEIISADSRQIYKGMDLGTGKVPGKWMFSSPPARGGVRGGGSLNPKSSISNLKFFYKSIPHHLIDFQNPARQYSVARFQREAKKIIADILKRGKLPIICGGTMHWIDAVLFNQNLPNVKPNKKLRAQLEKLTPDALYKKLLKLDPARAANIDKFNKRRLIRALEIILSTGQPVPVLPTTYNLPTTTYSTLWLGINLPQTDLYKKIEKRLRERFKQGMIKEVQTLHQGFRVSPRNNPRQSALSWKKLESFGLEYKHISQFLQKYPYSSPPARGGVRGGGRNSKILFQNLFTQLSYAIKHYSKRQMTWWKKNKEIIWIKPDPKKAFALTKKFLSKQNQ